MVDFECVTDTKTALHIMDKVRDGGVDLKYTFRLVGYEIQHNDGLTKFIFKVMPKDNIMLDDIT